MSRVEITDAFHQAARDQLRCTAVRVRYAYNPVLNRQEPVLELDVIHIPEGRTLTHTTPPLAPEIDLARHAANVAGLLLQPASANPPVAAPQRRRKVRT